MQQDAAYSAFRRLKKSQDTGAGSAHCSQLLMEVYMRKSPYISFLGILSCAATVADSQPPTPSPMGHSHGGTPLFLASMDASHVVPRSTSRASATGAFVADAVKRTVDYEITYHGVERPPTRTIALRNFDAGGNGALVHTICGGDATRCPEGASANLAGTWDGRGPVALDEKLLGELASGRIYVEVVGADGKPEIRGQLEPNGAMVPVKNFVAHLAAAPGVDSRGTGTAVMSEVHYADGRVAVIYRLTVADTSGTPNSAALATRGRAAAPLRLNTLPKSTFLSTGAAATGATLSGQYETRAALNRLSITHLGAQGADVGIVVATTRYPRGELFGVFKLVH